MRLRNTTTSKDLDITIPEGLYWTDPVYSNIGVGVSTDVCLLGRIAYLLTQITNTVDTNTFEKSYGSAGSYSAGLRTFTLFTTALTDSLRWQMADSACTAEGRRTARRLGISQLANDPTAALICNTGRPIGGIWQPDRGEAGDIDNVQTGFGSVHQAYDGTIYTTDVGEPMHSRVVTIDGLPAGYARTRARVLDLAASGYDYSFESVVWPWISRGEMVRYYADASDATSTYLDTAMTATTTTAKINTAIITANNTPICIDGEWMLVTSGANTTTLTVYRENPVAHVKFAPASTSFVGTFALAADGGNVNRSGYRPRRRALNDDRWDLNIALVQGRTP